MEVAFLLQKIAEEMGIVFHHEEITVEENRQRNEYLRRYYNPETGEGSDTGDRRILRLPAGAVLDEETLRGVLCFANAAGSLVTTRYGAIPAMPDERAVLACAAGGKTLVVDG